ncbi:MAG TPA: hypothetical protein DD399_11750 [Alcanivorax sp.]|jgi:Flp pilus assembly pilin Flp|nr:hypothetical protein [Alcanivorax sp.]HBL87515.1 hypothetical protein [Alcanivorax sp.]|tara:strand:- start:255 stop:503 length:249 start_codon:yes stop_codon:yes gene_type:complete
MKSLTIFTTASQQLAARLFSRGRTQADKQRGASALEYIVLAAVIVIAIITALTTTDIASKITDTFQTIVDQMPSGSGDETEA